MASGRQLPPPPSVPRLRPSPPHLCVVCLQPKPAQEHLTGKQYLGWKAIREKYAELTSRWEARARSREPELLPPPPAAPSSVRERSGPPPEERERSRDRERERERSPR